MKQKSSDREAAVAITYDQGSGAAPQVVASGYGEIAMRIMAIAKEEGVHMHKREEGGRVGGGGRVKRKNGRRVRRH